MILPVENLGVRALPRKRLYGKAREAVLHYLKKAQNNKCFYSFPGCTNILTVLAHKDDNKLNEEWDDWILSCNHCNAIISNRARGKAQDRSVKEDVDVHKGGEPEDTMEKNARTEPAWVEFITAQLNAAGVEHERKDKLTGMSAYIIEISVATVNRHWKKYGDPPNPLGPFELYRPNQGTAILVRLKKRPEK